MINRIKLGLLIFFLFCGLALPAIPAQAQESTFENRGQAQQFLNELSTFNKASARIRQPIIRLESLIRREFSRYQQAVNNSETAEEAAQNYQVALSQFTKARADFDRAIAFAAEIGSNSKFPEIKALAGQYVANLTRSRNRINNIAVAFKYNDIRAFDSETRGLIDDSDDMFLYWNANAPQFQTQVNAAKAQFTGIKPTKDIGCPYEEGTLQHALHCIMPEPMSSGTGN